MGMEPTARLHLQPHQFDQLACLSQYHFTVPKPSGWIGGTRMNRNHFSGFSVRSTVMR
jgi:hypothetical protein